MLSPRRVKYLILQMALLVFTLSAMICLLASVIFLLNPTSSYSLPNSLQNLVGPYLQTEHKGWWEPDYQAGSSCGSKTDCWNILYHLGGNGPWVEKVGGTVKGGIAVPEDCVVDMVHMMSRHAERFPTKTAGGRMIALFDRMQSIGRPLKGALEFVNDWEYFTSDPTQHFEQLTTTGPYSGILEAFTTGVKLSTRYQHLWNDTMKDQTMLWASECDRVIDTARYFTAGFFGLDSKLARLEIVSEAADKGGDTLTPGDTCKKYLDDKELGHDYGYKKLYEYRATYLGDISKRLDKENPGFNFTDIEIYSMQEMCGFETTIRGSSRWCDVFTHPEWLSFEYARDIIHYYRAGPGNPYAKSMGWLWLNATTNLLSEGPETAGPLYFSFVHDGDIVPMLAALGIFEDATDLPVDHIAEHRRWKTSQITPMGGRILFERISRTTDGAKFVRFNVNDGIVALPGCDSGPGSSCPLEEFVAYVEERGKIGGDFRETCGLDSDAPAKLTFLRQPAFGGASTVDVEGVKADVPTLAGEKEEKKPEKKKRWGW